METDDEIFSFRLAAFFKNRSSFRRPNDPPWIVPSRLLKEGKKKRNFLISRIIPKRLVFLPLPKGIRFNYKEEKKEFPVQYCSVVVIIIKIRVSMNNLRICRHHVEKILFSLLI